MSPASPHARRARTALSVSLLLGSLPALAQPARDAAPAPVPAGSAAAGAAAGGASRPTTGALEGRKNTAEERLNRLQPAAGGMTSEQVAARARGSSLDVTAKTEALRAAAARVDAALVNFFPRVSAVGRYTRLSAIDPPTLGGSGNSVAVVGLPPLTTVPAGYPLIVAPAFTFPVILDNYLVQGTLVVPISDYVTRISHGYAAATHGEEAARHDRQASEAKAVADAKVAFYNWVKALGAREVLEQALVAGKEHVKDAEALFKAGQAAKADLLGAQAQVASGELAVAQADEMVKLAEEQLRIATRTPDDQPITLGEDVTSQLPPAALDLAALKQEALATRAELKALHAGERALESVATVSRAGAWPQVAAFGDVIYANPNQRIFPLREEWKPTWDVGLQVTWSPNDMAGSLAAGAEADANAAKLRAQRGQARDGVMLEVTQAVQMQKTADAAVETSNLGLAAAEEGYRARREAYRVGRATSVELTDAEANLFRAKLVAVSARIDQRIARIKVEHAVGRDLAKLAPASAGAGGGGAGSTTLSVGASKRP